MPIGECGANVQHIVSIPGFAEPFSSLSHFVGAFAFAVLSIPLLSRGRGELGRAMSLAVFSFGAVLLLSLSGVTHQLTPGTNARAVLSRLDHAAIFVLIASTFTPVHAILFRGIGRWGMLLLIWGVAALGITLKMVFFEQIPYAAGAALYIGMGWIGLGSTVSLWRRYGFAVVQPIAWGGIVYTLGVVIEVLGARYGWPSPLPAVVQWHEVFHVAVLIGLACHWAFVFHIADGSVRPGPPTSSGGHRQQEQSKSQSASPPQKAETPCVNT
ncbi:MAG: hemolysin III family protein [Planctomycetota bacterium]